MDLRNFKYLSGKNKILTSQMVRDLESIRCGVESYGNREERIAGLHHVAGRISWSHRRGRSRRRSAAWDVKHLAGVNDAQVDAGVRGLKCRNTDSEFSCDRVQPITTLDGISCWFG